MNLSFLLGEIGIVPENDCENVSLITDEPEKITENCIFVCISGAHADGHAFAEKAALNGAAAVIGEKELCVPGYYRTENSRRALSLLCGAFYGHPEKKLRLIGITGTNGKTTTAEYVRFLLENTGHKCGLIGTLGCVTHGARRKTGFTTPGGDTLYGALAEMVKNGCEFCAAEISSQALAQYRADGLRFETGVFTNLGSDHLDYHKDLASYASAKGRLAELSDSVLINHDDAYAEKFASYYNGNKIKYYSARNGLADYMANNIKYEKNRVSYVLFCFAGVARVSFCGIGEFSVYNSLAAAAVCINAGVPFSEVTRLIGQLPQIPGRAQMFTDGRGVNVCVDFAHTPDALSSILLALQADSSGGIITVFGCGGDRDASKRPLMGKIAANMSKAVIITSDNPRSEEPGKIIAEIKSGIKRKADVFTEPNREKAIRFAVNKAQPGDTVLIAGKGHEETQFFGASETRFSDIECVKNILCI